MKYREEGIKPDQDSLDLRDATSEKEFIKFGPACSSMSFELKVFYYSIAKIEEQAGQG